MDVSIQQYRSRIGRFLPKHCNSSIRIFNSFKNEENQPRVKISFTITAFLTIAIMTPFLIAVIQNPGVHHKNHCYSHPLYPSAYLQKPTDSCHGRTTTDLHSRFIISYGLNVLASSSFAMVTNFQSRYLYGNRRTGIKISAWNKGGGFLQNKKPELKNIVNGLYPHILGISEANLKSSQDKNLSYLEDYTLHT